MKILLTLLFAFISFLSDANTITVGETKINIPSPKNYSAVSVEMPALFEFQKQFVGITNQEFISFILSSETPLALQNKIPNLDRRFSVQTAKDLVNKTVSISGFNVLKETVKNQNNEIIRKSKEAIDAQFRDINKNLSEKHKVDLALSLSNIIPQPVHIETERSLAYSVYVKYNINDKAGEPSSFVSITTATFVYVKGKILFLYSFAGESDLEWSQNISKQWANSIIKANPSGIEEKVSELLPINILGISWEQVGIKSLIGAFIGLLIGWFSWRYNIKKSSQKTDK